MDLVETTRLKYQQILPRVYVAIVLSLGGLFFGLSGLGKLSDTRGAKDGIHAHQILPTTTVSGLVLVVTTIELACAAAMTIALVIRPLRPWALLSTLSLLCSFTTYLLIVSIVRGPHESCACGAVISAGARSGAIRNLLIAAILLAGMVVTSRPSTKLAHRASGLRSGEQSEAGVGGACEVPR